MCVFFVFSSLVYVLSSRFVYRPYFWNSQSLLSRGQTDLAFNHREMQWKWKACWRSVSLFDAEKKGICGSGTPYVANAPGNGTLFAGG